MIIKDNNYEYEAKVKGKKDKMKKSSFEDKVLEFMSNMNEFIKEQREFNKKVDSRLDVLENDVKKIETRLDVLENDVKKIETRLDVLESFHKNDILKLKK